MNNLSEVKKWSIVLTSLFVIGYEWFRHMFILQQFSWKIKMDVEMWISAVVFVAGSFAFSEFVFGLIEKSEKKRLQQEREAKALFENSIDGIFVFNSDGYLVDMNHGAEEMTGWKRKDEHEKRMFDSVFQLEASELAFDTFLNGITTSIRVEDGLLLNKEGGEMPISATFSQIHDDYRDDTKIAVIVRDLTQQKQMADVIKGLYQEASQKQMEAETQYRIANKLASIRELTADNRQQIFESVVKEIQKLLGCTYVGLFLNEVAKENMDVVAVTDPDQRGNMVQTLQWVENKRELDTAQIFADPFATGQEISIYPLRSENLILGYIWVSENKDREWSLQQQDLLKSIINVLSISLENLMKYHKMKDIAMLEERERLAREMHDGLAQIISSIHMKIEFIKNLPKGNDQKSCPLLQEEVGELSKIVNEAYHEVRQNLFNLRSPFYWKGAFLELLENYIKQFEDQNQIEVQFYTQLKEQQDKIDLSENKKMHVVRILQEALSNVRRHSAAAKASLSIIYREDGHYVFTVEDKGIGFKWEDLETIDHYGLITMKERAKLINGEITIQTKPNEGTRVVLTIPSGGEGHD